jgi:GDPmannose 4,6-dehydratase
MKAIVFGANGQDGYYLTEALREKGIEPVGIDQTGAMLHGDVGDFAFVSSQIQDHLPGYIVHLAARSTTSHDALFANHSTISTGTLNILEAVYRQGLPARVLLCGSGVQFANDGSPISEQTPFAASSPYAVARIQSVYAARYYRSLGVRAYVAYLFHHESPRRPPDHVSQRIAGAARRIRDGSTEVLEIGDLSVAKEWNFAGDVVRGMLTLLEQESVCEAVIGSGETHTIQEWVEACFGLAGLDWKQHVRQPGGFVAEYKTLRSNPALIRSLGWQPRVGFQELARLMMQP